MKLIIQDIIKRKRILLCFLIFISATNSYSKHLKFSNIEETINSENLEEMESYRISNKSNQIKNENFKINFRLANVSLVFPQPIEPFRLSFNDNNEENRKTINPLLIPNNNKNNEKGNSRGSSIANNKELSDKNKINATSSRIYLREKVENIRSNQ